MPITDNLLAQSEDVFLKLGDEQISWKEVLSQFQAFGRLRPFLQEIASQKVLLDEIRSRTDLELDPASLDEAVTQFRKQKKLTDEETFKNWLATEQLDYPAFRTRIYFNAKLKLLKQRITAPDLNSEFERQQPSLDKLELSYLICKEENQALQFAEQLRTEAISFEALESQQAANPDVNVKASSTPLLRAWLPDDLRRALEDASPHSLEGPIQQGDYWITARIDNIIPAELDEAVENRLSNELFKRWLQQKLAGYQIRVAPYGSN